MKKLNYLIAALFVLFLSACSGSETYRGTWKATNPAGEKFELLFDEKLLTIKDNNTGGETSSSYSQNQINISNHVETYGIVVEDFGTCQVHFPYISGESEGFIYDASGNLMYTIGRDEYISPSEFPSF